MYRNVEINIPMFIAIILIISVVTGFLVYGIETLTAIRDESNNRINSELENIFNIESQVEDNFIYNEVNETQNIE